MKVLVLILSIILTQSLSSDQSRFVDNNDGTITDTKTGLIWLKNANFAGGKVDPSDKNIFLKIETATKRKNWRIPTDSDFLTFLDAFKPQDRIINLKLNGFINLQNQYAVYDSGDINNWLIPNNSRIEEPYPITSAYLWPVCDPEDKSAIEPKNTLVAVAEKPKTDEAIPQTTVEPKPEKPPAPSNSRFIDNNDGTITDTKTGLIWLKNANFAGGKINFDNSNLIKLEKMTGRKNWRIPTYEEFFQLLKDTEPNNRIRTFERFGFFNIKSEYGIIHGGDVHHFNISTNRIEPEYYYKPDAYLWPVCDPEEKSAIEFNNTLVAIADKPKTDEVIPQATVEPKPEKPPVQSNSRFVDNNDGTITDTKTGLIWLKNANFAGGKANLDTEGKMLLQKLSKTTKYKKWRIPRKEDFSNLLKDVKVNDKISTLKDAGFENIQLTYSLGGSDLYSILSDSVSFINGYYSGGGYFWPVCDPEEKSAIEPNNTLVAITEKPKIDEVIPQTTVEPIQEKATAQSNSRFVDNNDGTITDTKTGLIWLKNANFAGGKANLDTEGKMLLQKLSKTTKYKKWRIPRKEDFSSILKDVRVNDKISTLQAAGFENIQLTYSLGGGNLYSILSDSVSFIYGHYSDSGYFWPVCDPEEKSTVEPNTQTLVAVAEKSKTEDAIPLITVEPEKAATPSDSNITENKNIKSDDTLSASVDKPKTEEIITQTPEQNITPDTESNHPKKKILPRNKRFADGKDNTIIDKKTGLVWIKDTSQCGEKTWKEAVKYSKSFCGCGHKDWRLPCRKDFENLFKGRNNLSWEEFLETAGFSNIQPWYWTSTPSADFPKRDSYYANLNYGLISTNKNNKKCYVWLVRGKSK